MEISEIWINQLKRKAKLIKREFSISHIESLDKVAFSLGYENWQSFFAEEKEKPGSTFFDVVSKINNEKRVYDYQLNDVVHFIINKSK